MKLLFDENLSSAHAQAARDAGHDAVAVRECGLGGATDSEVWALAVAEERILVTLDADFSNAVRFPPAEMPGVIRLRPWPPTEQVIAKLLAANLPILAERSLAGKMVVIEPGRIRIR